ncbi:MAG: sigma-70 family RNA polymerase sigma factor [Elusimicrobia bacterium]|nr:sigma-70 family RNA polymerase sigma factor [Elusimicrobiota bacterium]
MLGKDAIAQAVRDHAGDLLRGALGLGFSEADAEELVQATFAALVEAAGRFEGRSTVRTYLFGILYRKALERRRALGRELAVDPQDQVFEGRFLPGGHWARPPRGPEQEADAREAAELIASCLERLPEPQRAAFHLREVLQEDAGRTCNVLGVTDTHLRVLLFRARAKLRECLEAKWKG